jgi:uncharacterized protein with HEPN domain
LNTDDVRSDRVRLLHINDSIDKILKYTTLGEEEFYRDTKTQDAVIRNIEIIGEATKNISISVREKYPEIPLETDQRNER